ncbi:hypothetical protein B296_00009948 [Ensete ventricosum]|uniref:alpha,alpha-trehalose-phosphate synthase (UDP-forming) n=1 Tax=Ensete ventricosum TaxID=4639 RepID=A0A426ZQF2_ENSVE|nr:hypothetical protein B296_00009948 [Ensete ventricosum]
MTTPGIINDTDEGSCTDEDSCTTTSLFRDRKIIVANFLPLNSMKDQTTGEWCFTWDEDALLLQLKDGFSYDTEVIYVGSLKADIDVREQEVVSQKLLEEYGCMPTFLSPDLYKKYYHGFCKKQLWPLFHYMLPIGLHKGDLFDHSLFQAYVSANKKFADKVLEVINSDDDYVWIHDYHLMLLPTFLRKRLNRIKIGFFLHSPFPSSEIYRTLPVREEILKALLNADLIGFQTYDYARHFLSCCSRMLGLHYESKRGYIGLEYYGRIVSIKILSVGVHIGRLHSVLNHPHTISKVQEIEKKFKGKKLLLGVDDMDIFKGISLKLLAFELLVERSPCLRGNIVLVQIVNPARSTGKDVKEAREEAISIAERINNSYGTPGYDPVVLIDKPIPFYERIAYYVAAECCIVNAVRDGMNLVSYEYVVCRQGTEEMDKCRGVNVGGSHTSTLIVSEFVGCSPSLSGAFRVNPWSVEDVADNLHQSIILGESERQLRHEKHYRYVSTHHVAYWAHSFSQDLKRACKDYYSQRCWALGFGLNFRVLFLSPNFRKLTLNHIVSSYKNTYRRAIFLDYDGTIMPESSVNKTPSQETISILNGLCSDPNNTVFIVSGRGKDSLSEWFISCENLGIAAEHGYFIRWRKGVEWESNSFVADSDWMKIAKPVIQLYTDTTDGSFVEVKESAIVWHHQYADHDFGPCQAKELLDHLESVLANEPVVVKRGQHIVQVKPQVQAYDVEDLPVVVLRCFFLLYRHLTTRLFTCRDSKPTFELSSPPLKQGQVPPAPDPNYSNLTTFLAAISGHRPLMKFEGGYTVDTVFDGSKLGIEPYSIEVTQNGELLLLDSVNSNLYRIAQPLSRCELLPLIFKWELKRFLHTFLLTNADSRPKLIAGSPEGHVGHVDGRPREARMNHPRGFTVDGRGNIYIADTTNMAIRKISDTGKRKVPWISQSNCYTCKCQVACSMELPSEQHCFCLTTYFVFVQGSQPSLEESGAEVGIQMGRVKMQSFLLILKLFTLLAAALFWWWTGGTRQSGRSSFILAIVHTNMKLVFLLVRLDFIQEPQTPTKASMSPYQKPMKPSMRPPLIPIGSEAENMDDEGLFSSMGKFLFGAWSSTAEIFAAMFPIFRKKPKTARYQQQQRKANTRPMPESFVIPNDEMPPPVDTKAPTPHKTYAFMSKEPERIHHIRHARTYHTGWDAEPQQQQRIHRQQHLQQHQHHSSGPRTFYEQSCDTTNEIVFGAVQESDSKRKSVEIKTVNYGDPIYEQYGLRFPNSYMGYDNY